MDYFRINQTPSLHGSMKNTASWTLNAASENLKLANAYELFLIMFVWLQIFMTRFTSIEMAMYLPNCQSTCVAKQSKLLLR